MLAFDVFCVMSFFIGDMKTILSLRQTSKEVKFMIDRAYGPIKPLPTPHPTEMAVHLFEKEIVFYNNLKTFGVIYLPWIVCDFLKHTAYPQFAYYYLWFKISEREDALCEFLGRDVYKFICYSLSEGYFGKCIRGCLYCSFLDEIKQLDLGKTSYDKQIAHFDYFTRRIFGDRNPRRIVRDIELIFPQWLIKCKSFADLTPTVSIERYRLAVDRFGEFPKIMILGCSFMNYRKLEILGGKIVAPSMDQDFSFARTIFLDPLDDRPFTMDYYLKPNDSIGSGQWCWCILYGADTIDLDIYGSYELGWMPWISENYADLCYDITL